MGLLRLIRLSKYALGLLILPFLALALAGPVGAETKAKPQNPSTVGAPPKAAAKSTTPAPKLKLDTGIEPAADQGAAKPNTAQPAADQGAAKPNAAQPPADQAAVKPEPPADAAAHEAASANIQPGQQILVNIDKSTQEMTVFVDGIEQYNWKVSTGRGQYDTPSGTFTPTSMNEMWYSKQWDNSPMPHAIFFMKDGHAIHGTHEVKNLGKPASHGCVRLAPENAATLYAMVEKTGMENTQVVLSGEMPGTGPRVASPAPQYQYPISELSAQASGRGAALVQPRSGSSDAAGAAASAAAAGAVREALVPAELRRPGLLRAAAPAALPAARLSGSDAATGY